MMKPFNLEEYLKNPSRKVVTRLGKPVRIACSSSNKEDFPIIAEVQGSMFYKTFTDKGKYMSFGDSNYDLFFAPEKKEKKEKHEGWINLYRNEDGISWISPNYFTSKREAEKEGKAHTCSVTTVKIEWEE